MKARTTAAIVSSSNVMNSASTRIWTKRLLRSPPLAVTTNFWPFGLVRPCQTALRMLVAASRWLRSPMIGSDARARQPRHRLGLGDEKGQEVIERVGDVGAHRHNPEQEIASGSARPSRR